MSGGKSWAGLMLAKSHYLRDPTVRIVITSERTYYTLLKHIPAENLIKYWEKREEGPLEVYWEEYE